MQLDIGKILHFVWSIISLRLGSVFRKLTTGYEDECLIKIAAELR